MDDPAHYILLPEHVKARFPAELLYTPDGQAIIDACIERLGPRPTSGVQMHLSNNEGGDFSSGTVTLTVTRLVERMKLGTA
jgi:hypothetical protein